MRLSRRTARHRGVGSHIALQKQLGYPATAVGAVPAVGPHRRARSDGSIREVGRPEPAVRRSAQYGQAVLRIRPPAERLQGGGTASHRAGLRRLSSSMGCRQAFSASSALVGGMRAFGTL